MVTVVRPVLHSTGTSLHHDCGTGSLGGSVSARTAPRHRVFFYFFPLFSLRGCTSGASHHFFLPRVAQACLRHFGPNTRFALCRSARTIGTPGRNDPPRCFSPPRTSEPFVSVLAQFLDTGGGEKRKQRRKKRKKRGPRRCPQRCLQRCLQRKKMYTWQKLLPYKKNGTRHVSLV